MKLLHAIVVQPDNVVVRVVIVVRPSSSDGFCYELESDLEQARSILDLVCNEPIRRRICDTSAPTSAPRSPLATNVAIEAGEVDLVVMADLTRYSRRVGEVVHFLEFCERFRVRVISFDDHVDTADANWRETVMNIFAAIHANDIES